MERCICNICQRFFYKEKNNQKSCHNCAEKDRKEFDIVKEYLYTNNRASLMDVYLSTKVPMKTLKRYIYEGRIHITNK